MKITALYFSPTYSTKNITTTIAREISSDYESVDIASIDYDGSSFDENDLVIIGVPVYSGRVPKLASENINKIKVTGAKVVTIVVYGNRDYEDALLELSDLSKQLDFTLVAAGAFIAQHTYSKGIGSDRPDAQDNSAIKDFSQKIMDKIKTNSFPTLSIPGNQPYREYTSEGPVPLVNDYCIFCGSCANQCPTKAIPKDAPNTTNAKDCIHCARCLRLCPTEARHFDKDSLEKIDGFLKAKASERKDIQLFI